jgi:hypothetical protein
MAPDTNGNTDAKPVTDGTNQGNAHRPAPAAPAPEPALRDFHDALISREVRRKFWEAYTDICGDTALLDNLRLITDGRDTFAIARNYHGYCFFNLENWGFEFAVPAATCREIAAWLAGNPEPPYLQRYRLTLDDEQVERLRRLVNVGGDYLYTVNPAPPTYEAMSLDGETYVLSSGRVFQWTERPRPEFINAGDERGEEVKRWLLEHPRIQPEETDGAVDKDTEALKVLHEIVDPHVQGIHQGAAVKEAQMRGVSQVRATRLLRDPSHFRFEAGKSKKDGNRIFPLTPEPGEAEEPEDANF